MKRILSLMAVIVLLLGTVIYADAGYVGLTAGLFIPNGAASAFGPSNAGNVAHGGLNGFDAGPDIEVQYGAVLHPNIHFEASGGVFSTSTTSGTSAGGSHIGLYSIPTTITFKAVQNFDGANIFLGSGIGMYYVYAQGMNPSGVTRSDSTAGFGYHLTAGGEISVDPSWGFIIEAKWFRSNIVLANLAPGATIDIGGTVLSIATKEAVK